jgi:hypothetical protein
MSLRPKYLVRIEFSGHSSNNLFNMSHNIHIYDYTGKISMVDEPTTGLTQTSVLLNDLIKNAFTS